MLLTLQVENVAIIEQLEMNFMSGFTVLSGETGAGKSILIEAINALVGGRTSRELIRTGAEKAVVNGVFHIGSELYPLLSEYDIEIPEDNMLLLQRNFTDSGRNSCRINGTLVSAGVLRIIGEKLLAVHGQHDNLTLLRNETHLNLLDSYAGPGFLHKKAEYSELYNEYCLLQVELKKVTGSERERKRQIDTLRFQFDELEKAKLKKGEDIELEKKSNLLQHAEAIVSAFSESYALLSGDDMGLEGARELIRRAGSILRRIMYVSNDFAEIVNQITDLSERLDDISRDIVDVRDGTEFDPIARDKIEERLAFLQSIRKKYGDTVDDCIQYYEDISKKLVSLENSDSDSIKLQEQLSLKKEKLAQLAHELHDMRVNAGKALSNGISNHLKDLEMQHAVFHAEITLNKLQEFDENGLDSVEYLFTANTGEPLKALSKIASGGEMSRVMLAIKTMLADIDQIPTLIFDEIDAGVGGKAAQKVGEKLFSLAKSRQILCVTHHAQIASYAVEHYYIGKEQEGGRTRTKVTHLSGEERETEITRLLSGAHRTASAHGLAKELLARGSTG